MTTEPFPDDVAATMDRAWADHDKNMELDAQGRFVRGLFAGMTPAQVMAGRDAFNRAMPNGD